MRQKLLEALDRVDRIARANRLRRWWRRPLGYPAALLHRLLYQHKGGTYTVSCSTFFGSTMSLALPSGMDIYLTGGKAHESEIRLARFMISMLQPGDTFVDIGAHYGYFTLMAARLVGDGGKVISFEAAPKTYRLLAANVDRYANVVAYHGAVSNIAGHLSFYEFPNLYSEYNSLHLDQYFNESWYESNHPEKVTVPAVRMDEFFEEHSLSPTVIKIDVEGAEFQVISGGCQYLETSAPSLVMEYLHESRSNAAHRRALTLLRKLGYGSYVITDGGELAAIEDIEVHLEAQGLESDNIVFRKLS